MGSEYTLFEHLVSELPEISPDSIVSRTLYDDDQHKLILWLDRMFLRRMWYLKLKRWWYWYKEDMILYFTLLVTILVIVLVGYSM